MIRVLERAAERRARVPTFGASPIDVRYYKEPRAMNT